MEKRWYKSLNETVFFEKLPNGLEVYLLPKNDYNKTYVTFSTRYGSLDNEFVPFGKQESIIVPEGVAHFLEHKMFEMEDGDAFMKLGSMGANSNAFTSYSRTAYLFSATDNIKPAVEYLLDFVQTPYFTKESVDKEKGIIAQEIKMYEDYPDFRCQMNLLRNMYEKHPIRVDIVGTVESINQITPEILRECYDTFYHPSNMQIFVIGNFNLDEIYLAITSNQKSKSFVDRHIVQKEMVSESANVLKKYGSDKMAVSVPRLALGVKLPVVNRSSQQQMTFEVAVTVLMALLFGESSDYYEQLMNEGLINEGFEISGNHEPGIDFIMANAETTNPEKLQERLISILTSIDKFVIDNDDFARIKNALIGNYVNLFNSLEAISNYFTRFSFMNMDFFTIIDSISELKVADVEDLKKYFVPDAISTFVIFPEE